MNAKLIHVDHKEVKTLFIGEDVIVISTKRESDPEKFINFHKYPKIMESSERLKFSNFQEFQLKDNDLLIRANSRSTNEKIKLDQVHIDQKNKQKLKEALSTINRFTNEEKVENKLMSVLNSTSFYIAITSAIMLGLLLSGTTDFESSNSRKGRAAGKLLQWLLDTIGPVGAIILFSAIFVIGVYFMIKKFRNPSVIEYYKLTS